jgi:hypothetical protein
MSRTCGKERAASEATRAARPKARCSNNLFDLKAYELQKLTDARLDRSSLQRRCSNRMRCSAHGHIGEQRIVLKDMPIFRERRQAGNIFSPGKSCRWSGVRGRAIRRRVVVFPHPDGPSNTTNSPRSTARLKSRTAGTPRKTLETECRLRALIAYRGSRRGSNARSHLLDCVTRACAPANRNSVMRG